MGTLEEEFEQAVDAVSNGACGSPPPQELSLRLYGLFKVAREGPCSEQTPPSKVASLTARGKKTLAWMEMSGMSKEVAMTEYTLLVVQNASKRDADASAGFGPRAPSGFDFPADPPAENQVDLCHYASLGDLRSIQTLLSRQKADVNFRDEESMTALMRAADRGNLAVVTQLLVAGADVNLQDVEGQTALHYASFCEHIEVVVELVRYGSDVHIEDKNSETPLSVAASPQVREAMMNAVGTTPPATTWPIVLNSKMSDSARLGMVLAGTAGALVFLALVYGRHKRFIS